MKNRSIAGTTLIRFVGAAALTFNTSACRTMSDVVKAKNAHEGTTRVYAIACDDAYNLALRVFRDEGADAIEEHRSEGYMLTSSGRGPFTWGTLMGAWFEPTQTRSCVVTCVTKRKVATGAVTTLTESTFHDRLAQAVVMKVRSAAAETSSKAVK